MSSSLQVRSVFSWRIVNSFLFRQFSADLTFKIHDGDVMNDRQLETFLKIVDCGSFSKAESLLYCFKQALVKRITVLETEREFILFERRHCGIRLTAAGEQFYTGPRKLLQLEKEMLDACRA